jgi:hypothetical protein
MTLCDFSPKFQVRLKIGFKKVRAHCAQLFNRLKILNEAWVWTKGEHKHFPPSFRQAIWTMFLCRKRTKVFCRVPKDVLVYEIIPIISKVWTKPSIIIQHPVTKWLESE